MSRRMRSNMIIVSPAITYNPNTVSEMCSGSEAGSYLRRIDS